LTQVKSLALGVTLSPNGTQRVTVYFDQLRLFPQRCVPERTLAGDLNGDCTVDEADLAILTDRWLEGTIEIVAAEPLSQPAVWHKFDRVNNTTLGFDDERHRRSGVDGLAVGLRGRCVPTLCQRCSLPCFGGWRFHHAVDVPGLPGSRRVRPRDRSGGSRGVGRGGPGRLGRPVESLRGGEGRDYHNGRLVAENAGAFQSTPNSGGMRIGATNQPIPQRLYHGKVDDFRMYAAVLPQAAILYLADGTRIDQAPVTPADINGDGVVDQADRDILEANMGEVTVSGPAHRRNDCDRLKR